MLISQHGEVKLADFGIAKAVDKSEKSATGIIKGKFAYMSPEQSQARPLDARSDLFSVGTVLYLLTTGRKPFDGPTDADVIMQVRRARPEKPSTLVKDLNPDVERLINRALRADPAKRWQSAEQMADRIDAILLKLGQPSGPAPLKRWLETLSARDGAKPPVADAAAATDPSIAVDLGSLDLELEEVAATIVEEDRGTGVDTRLERAGAEPTAHSAPTRAGRRASRSAGEGRGSTAAGDGRRRRALHAMGAPDDHPRGPHPRGGRRRGSTWPGLTSRPGPRQPIDNWLRRLSALVGQRHL